MGRTQQECGMHNTFIGSGRDSERSIVAMKRSNLRGAKGPYRKHALNNNNGDRLSYDYYGMQSPRFEDKTGNESQTGTEVSVLQPIWATPKNGVAICCLETSKEEWRRGRS